MKTSSSKQKIRLIGGEHKRSLIPVVDIPQLRPTSDRVRETLFNWIHYFWEGNFADKQVLDLFAGSGALGFEAASRGVAHVQMVESHPKAQQQLRAFRDKHQLNQVRIHAGDAFLVLKRMDASRFDLILLDPPFGQGDFDQIYPHLATICEPGTLIYTESESPLTWEAPFESLRKSKAGAVHFQLFQYTPEKQV